MRPLTAVELEVIETLIADADDMIAQLTQVLRPDEPAVTEVAAARNWLDALRRTGIIP
jgi:hypothetical protein